MTTPKPPPGFVPIDQYQASQQPKPPEGFVPAGNMGGDRSGLNELGRQLGLTGRAIAGGLAQAAEPFTEPVRYLMNQALPGNPVGNIEAATDQALTSIGVPEPQGTTERGVQSVGRFATSAGAGLGIERGAEKLLSSALNGRWASEAAPTLDQLKEMGRAAYQSAEDAKLVINPGSFGNFAGRLTERARQAGIHPKIHPKAYAALESVQEAAEAGKPLRLEDIEVLRKLTQGAKSSIEKDERRVGGIISEELTRYIDRLGDADIVAGDRKMGAEALSLARNVWTRKSRTEDIQQVVENAVLSSGQYSGSGFENAIRTQFRQLAKNPRRMRGFSPAEQEAIKRAAMGDKLEATFRTLGKLAPTGIVSGTLGGSAAYALGGPVATAAVWGAGLAGKKAATELAKKNVRTVDQMVRRGTEVPSETPEWLLPWLSGGIFGTDTQD